MLHFLFCFVVDRIEHRISINLRCLKKEPSTAIDTWHRFRAKPSKGIVKRADSKVCLSDRVFSVFDFVLFKDKNATRV